MHRLFKHTAVIGLFTLSSRILGVVRDALIAMFFGTGVHSDAFFIAFRPFDLIRKLFSEGTLSTSFVPTFSNTYQTDNKKEAIQLMFSLMAVLLFISVTFILAGIIFTPFIVKIIAPGYADVPDSFILTGFLFKLMLPYIGSVLLLSVCMGVLNTIGHFGAPALAPALFNVTIIVFTLFICNRFTIPITGLAVGVTIGGILQLIIQVPYLLKNGLLNFEWFRIFHPSVLHIFKIMLPCMVGAASYQINIVIASFYASKLPEGSVSSLYFADRLVQFPLALFAISAATVFLPELSKNNHKGQLTNMAPIFTRGVQQVFFIIMPAMAGLMALNQEIVIFLFKQGQFDETAVRNTSTCLFYLVTGLWAFAGVRLFVTVFYALEKYRIPFYCGVVSVFINLIGCHFSVSMYGILGLVFSVSLASGVGFILLFLNLPSRIEIRRSAILISTCRSFFLSVIMFCFVKFSIVHMFDINSGKIAQGIGLSGAICIGILSYGTMNWLISTPEFNLVKKMIIEKLND